MPRFCCHPDPALDCLAQINYKQSSAGEGSHVMISQMGFFTSLAPVQNDSSHSSVLPLKVEAIFCRKMVRFGEIIHDAIFCSENRKIYLKPIKGSAKSKKTH